MAGQKNNKSNKLNEMTNEKLMKIDDSNSTEHLKNIVLEEMIKGTTITDISKIVHKTRQTIYNWLDTEDMKAKLDTFRRQNLKQVANAISLKSNIYMNELEKVAMTTKDEKIKTNILCYLLDHAVGKATTKIEQKVETTDKTQQIEDIDSILEDLDVDVVNVEPNDTNDCSH